MLRLSDARNFRRTAAGICLILGPVLLLINSAITTVGGEDTAEYLGLVAERRGTEELSAVLGILGFALLIPGIVGALNLLRGRGVVLGHIGGSVAVVGLACFCALLSTSFIDVAATGPGADTEAYVEIVDNIDEQAGAIVIVATALLGTLVGFVLLGAAFIRARTAPVWVGILIIVGVIVVGPLGGESDSRVLSVIGNALLLAAYGTVGLILLRQSDEDWDRPALGRAAAESPAPAEAPRAP